MDPYPFSLDDAVNEGARKTRPAFDQKSWAAYFIKALQDLLRLSVRQVSRSSHSGDDTLSWP